VKGNDRRPTRHVVARLEHVHPDAIDAVHQPRAHSAREERLAERHRLDRLRSRSGACLRRYRRRRDNGDALKKLAARKPVLHT
jgi:hypothetical protein